LTGSIPLGIGKNMSAADLVDQTFLAYNGGRLREAAQIVDRKNAARRRLHRDEPDRRADPGRPGQIVPDSADARGFVDWIVSTGANLYHDLHYGLDMALYQGSPFLDDVALHRDGVIRIYDILFDYNVLLDTDAFVREVIQGPEFQRAMGTDEFHYLLGKYVSERGRQTEAQGQFGAGRRLRMRHPGLHQQPGRQLHRHERRGHGHARFQTVAFDVNRDVNQTAAIVYGAKSGGRKSSVFILGGGSPKNFMLQTEPQIQEVMGIAEKGHDYFLQCTDARPDTGGLSGATPGRGRQLGQGGPGQPARLRGRLRGFDHGAAVADRLRPDRHRPRKLKRLYDRRDEITRK
jgi:deoxyhypusine synthase